MLKKYLLVRRQHNQGCDYSISCGTSVTEISAASQYEALKKIASLPEDWKKQLENAEDEYEREYLLESFLCSGGCLKDYDPTNERFCSQIFLYEVVSDANVLPFLQQKLAEVREVEKSLNDKAVEDKERKEFERLKKKFE